MDVFRDTRAARSTRHFRLGTAAGILALEALRIAAWRPRAATELDGTAIPHEFDWIRSAVHLAKGCYRGQETVAKVHNLGHPPRRLVMLHLDGSDNVAVVAGDEVLLGDKVVGRVTSSGTHYELGPIALAVVRRNTDPAATLDGNHVRRCRRRRAGGHRAAPMRGPKPTCRVCPASVP